VARNIGPGELERRVAFVPRQFPHGDSARDEKLVESFVEAAKRFLADGTIDDVVVVAHAHGPTPIEDDREIAAQVVESVADPRCRLVDQDLAPSELQALYGACGFVVTVRLHAAILGLSQGTPALASKHDRDALMRAQAEREERLREAFAQHRN
jgi:polysaccharide pyruvyl transferase WcaK-like protein